MTSPSDNYDEKDEKQDHSEANENELKKIEIEKIDSEIKSECLSYIQANQLLSDSELDSKLTLNNVESTSTITLKDLTAPIIIKPSLPNAQQISEIEIENRYIAPSIIKSAVRNMILPIELVVYFNFILTIC